MKESAQTEIVILGGGFGGVITAKYLLRKLLSGFHITLVDKHEYQDFHADLYEVASSWIEEDHRGKHDYHDIVGTVSLPYKDIFSDNKNITTLADEVVEIDLKRRKVKLSSEKILDYNYLVVALGSESNFFGIPNLEEHSFALKSVDDAMNLRNEIEERFFDPNPELNILIGGGGFTGVELAAELTNFIGKICKNKNLPQTGVTITILEATEGLLGGAEDWSKKLTQKRLEKLGVKVRLNSPIKNVTKTHVELANQEKLSYDILVWTAGVKGNHILAKTEGFEITKMGSIVVDKYLKAKNLDNVFALGDAATYFEENSKPAPPTAQKAIHEGKLVASNLANQLLDYPLLPYKSKKPTFMIPLGGKYALGKIGPVKFTGLAGWIVRELIALRYFSTILPFSVAFDLWLDGVRVFERNDS
ncbi:MAG: NAD(P)/FAD-dependent oxidoreductase [bacterium]|nr:NAD(P)/FAD-dependent oxidoreductase [bacterium]